MNQENKICQNCKQNFIIELEDFDFYKKMEVPPPTWCPECRNMRRALWRNELTLYKRRCNVPGHSEEIISMYVPTSPLTVYDNEYWWSDAWDPLSYGRDFDFSRPFFEQLKELIYRVPVAARADAMGVQSQFCNFSLGFKNCYFSSAGWANEECIYSNRIDDCKDSGDLFVCHTNSASYENVDCTESFKLFYSTQCKSCTESYFLFDCRNCSNCIGCTNLRNKSYFIFNKPYSKEEYMQKLKDFSFDSYSFIQNFKKEFDEKKKNAIRRYAQVYNCTNVIGDNVADSRNCYQCFDLTGGAENVKYTHWGINGLKDTYDTGPGTGGHSELMYEGISTAKNNSRYRFNALVWESIDVEYNWNCYNCRNIFGCSGLRNKQYCILNRQYTKEEYEAFVLKIKEQMNAVPYIDTKGRIYLYGEFMPSDFAPFAFNESVAFDYWPLDEERAINYGFRWVSVDKKQYVPTMDVEKIPDAIHDVSGSICNEIITCEHRGACSHKCPGAFRVVPQELEFYKKYGIPVPHLCFNCRHSQRLKERNPMKLWHRLCMKSGCTNEFETSYTPERPEIVYCESCYQKEVF
ncbi:MAG: hypothetical protein AB1333_03830 [Patescibacteria group bacterium]